MEEIIRTRLKMMNDSLSSLISSGNDVITKLQNNNITFQEANVVKNKLTTLNERFVTEMYNYFKLVQQPSADELFDYTSLQMKADEISAEIEARAQSLKASTSESSLSNDNKINTTSRLPKLELAKFDGEVLKWHEFWDQFSSNVDKRNINNVDKLLYLKSVLEGEAKQAIEGLDTTNKNYDIAVQTLKDRYGKPAAIIDAHYVALYQIKAAGNSAKECRNALNEIEQNLRVLQSLGEDVNHNHLRVMIMEKFPEDLIYELQMKLDSEEESIQNIRKQLEIIISARETSNRLKRKMKGSVNEKFTLETFHVRSEKRKKDDRKNYFGKKFQNEGNKKFESKNFDRKGPKKRPYEGNKSTDYKDQEIKRIKLSCIFCQMNHYNDECSKNIQERKRILKGRCFNCFKMNHKATDCSIKRKCHHCGKFGLHNRALCPNKKLEQKIPTNNLHINDKVDQAAVILQTATVHIYKSGDSSRFVNCRLLLDCGSQRSYISNRITKDLGLPILEENQLSVFTFGAKAPKIIDSPVVNFEMVTKTNKTMKIYANAVSHITNGVLCPYRKIKDIERIPNIEEIVFADDGSRDDQVDILIGNDYYYSCIFDEKIEVRKGLFLVNTLFGWVWSGRCSSLLNNRDQLSVLTYFQSRNENEDHFNQPDLPLRNDNLKRLWDLESIGIVDCPKISRDEEAINNFNDTTMYVDNRYHVKWPWVEYPPTKLPNNYGLAFGRLTNLMKRLDKKTIRDYDEVLQDQLQKGIIEKITCPSASKEHPIHYLPHHCVMQPGKSLRIVYDASAKTKENCSLNECLYRGPLMLEDLTGLLIRFRKHTIGIVADVEKAFLQIGLQQEDKDSTRFLWVKDINQPVTADNLIHLRFSRVPFGVISSPFLLNATIKFHLTKSCNEIDKQIAKDIYVDNIVTGTETINEAIVLYQKAKTSFKELSMNLRDWNSNSKEFMMKIPAQDRDQRTDTIKVLGVEWSTQTDILKLNPKYNDIETINTKREILKIIASIYDPCGFVAPILLPAKLLLQETWRLKLKWDETIPEEILKKWQDIVVGLYSIKTLNIHRQYAKPDSQETKFELHGFTDASMKAYAAVIYLRAYDETNSYLSFLVGKSRLAPIKDQENLQIPKLELLGAVIGNRLIQYAMKFLALPIQKQFLWVDSEIVLSWYNSEKLLPPFVSRRISEIKQNKSLNLRYVPTDLNPADRATRPLNTDSNNEFWLSGPEFLTRHPKDWPKTSIIIKEKDETENQTSSVVEALPEKINTENQEIRKEGTSTLEREEINIMLVNENDKESQIDENDEETQTKEGNDHSLADVQSMIGETEIIRKIQEKHFSNEVQGLKTSLSKSLDLFKDKNGLLRCGGRFHNSDWSEEKRFPILLPKDTDFTIKVIEAAHKENYHVGVSHTLAIVRNKYWILQGRSQVQKVLKTCLSCRKYGGGPYKMPLMPPLPAERVRYSEPFTFTGLDYFGPLIVQEGPNTEKRWICLYTCMAVRAIHMEVVKDLTAEECVMAIRRFVATRGLPQVITSDNASQFKLSSEVLASDYCIRNEVRWRFIPELAPWFGGFYERLIGIVKNCLKRTIEKHLINNNQLCTIIKEIESVVNTRPLTAVGQDLERILTPADFLRVGGVLIPEISDIDFLQKATVSKENLIMGWKRGQIILQEYIKMFISQYLTSLREIKNIHNQTRVVDNRVPKVGDLVQIKSDHTRALWKVGHISAVITSSDGQIRVAKVTMPSGETLTRSIGHLYPLELEDDHNIRPGRRAIETSHCDKTNEQETTSDSQRKDQLPGLAIEQRLDLNSSNRPQRASAQRAREKVRQWTRQLFTLSL